MYLVYVGVVERLVSDIRKYVASFSKPSTSSSSPSPSSSSPLDWWTTVDTAAAPKATEQSGYCYIGREKGFRSCIGVGPNDACVSHQIYPTLQVCVNPSLRA